MLAAATAWYGTRFVDSVAIIVVGWCALSKAKLISVLVLTMRMPLHYHKTGNHYWTITTGSWL